MRTIIDITDEQVKALDEISEIEGTSRAALIRQAIDRMLAEETRAGEVAQAAFGLWSQNRKDGIDIEAALRRGKMAGQATKAPPAKPIPAPAPPPVIEDSFVTPEVPSAPPVKGEVKEGVLAEVAEASAKPAEPPPPVPAKPTPSVTTAVDPLAAFFAGVKP